MAIPKTVTLGTAAWIFLVGAIASPTLGFYLGSWTFTSKAEQMAKERADSAVVAALAPGCAEKFRAQPDAATRTTALRSASNWARVEHFKGPAEQSVTPHGERGPNKALVDACAELILNPPRAPK